MSSGSLSLSIRLKGTFVILYLTDLCVIISLGRETRTGRLVI